MELKKILFIVINVILALFGLALMIIGAVMHDKGDTLDKDEVTSLLNEVSFDDNLKLGNVVNSLSVFLICLGIFVFLIALFGIAVACLWMLRSLENLFWITIVYAIILLLICVVQLVALGFWGRMAYKVDSKLQGELTTMLYSYAGVTSTNEVSNRWDLVFLRYDCCGVDDISSTSNPDEFSGSTWWNERNGTADKVPASCCTGATEDNYKSYNMDADCQLTLLTHRMKGCYEKFKDWLYGYEVSAILFSVLLILTQIAAIVIAVLLIQPSDSVAP